MFHSANACSANACIVTARRGRCCLFRATVTRKSDNKLMIIVSILSDWRPEAQLRVVERSCFRRPGSNKSDCSLTSLGHILSHRRIIPIQATTEKATITTSHRLLVTEGTFLCCLHKTRKGRAIFLASPSRCCRAYPVLLSLGLVEVPDVAHGDVGPKGCYVDDPHLSQTSAHLENPQLFPVVNRTAARYIVRTLRAKSHTAGASP
jgi:hypothetical protein